MRALRNLFLALAVLAAALAPRAAQTPPTDDYLLGYVTAVLQHELKLPPGAYELTVQDGTATILLPGGDQALQTRVWEALHETNGLIGLIVKVVPRPAAPTAGKPSLNPEAEAALPEMRRGRTFPEGDVFETVLADPKQPQSFVSFRRFHSSQVLDSPSRTITMASVGYGGIFGLYRVPTRNGKGAFQVGMDGALFAQFNMDAPSHDLINADYTVGIPLTFRYEQFSMRFRVYHQSSHLGDEYLLRYHPKRINLSYEALSLLLARDLGRFRIYGGGEYRLDRDPATLRPGMAEWGVEYRGLEPLFKSGRLVAGLDVKNDQANSWNPSASLKAGLEFGSPDPRKRHLRVFLVGYDGFSPYGQFYTERVQYAGFEVDLAF